MDMQIMNDTVAQNVDVLRALRGVRTRAELARKADIHPGAFSRIMNGKQQWTLENLAQVAEVLGARPGDLLGDTASLVGATGTPAAAKAAQGNVNPLYVTAKPNTISSPARVFPLVRPIRPAETDVTQPGASTRVVISDVA